jgi:hypothetical protein
VNVNIIYHMLYNIKCNLCGQVKWGDAKKKR